ncbi:MAG: phage holin family protein [Acidimicrobiales bacterium]|nr:phage holin family protein [Acidimicrobiales bacterium]
MIRLVASAVVALLADAVALLVTSLVLDDVTLDATGFVVGVVVFTVVGVFVEPLLRQTALKSAPALLGSSSLVATLVSLVVATLVADGLQISGALTWVLATVMVWLIALGARLLLPLVIFKKTLARAR